MAQWYFKCHKIIPFILSKDTFTLKLVKALSPLHIFMRMINVIQWKLPGDCERTFGQQWLELAADLKKELQSNTALLNLGLNENLIYNCQQIGASAEHYQNPWFTPYILKSERFMVTPIGVITEVWHSGKSGAPFHWLTFLWFLLLRWTGCCLKTQPLVLVSTLKAVKICGLSQPQKLLQKVWTSSAALLLSHQWTGWSIALNIFEES